MTAAEMAVTARMALGQSRAVALPTAGTAALILFDGAAGARVSLNLTASTISQGDLSIVRPDGTNLVAPAFFGTSGVFLDTVTLPAAGTYTILVNPRSSYSGSATLTLHDVPPDLTGSISPAGAPVTVTLAVPGQNALLALPGVAGSSYTLTLSAVTISQSDVSVLKPDGTNLVSPTFVSTSGKKIKFTAPTTGTYTIVVNPRGAVKGQMTLKL